MSKIGKQPIEIPEGVTASFEGAIFSVKGSNGEFNKEVPTVLDVQVDDKKIIVSVKEGGKPKDAKKNGALWGLHRSLIQNYVTGVSKGFDKVLEFEGVGYKAALKGNDLELNLGYSHPITVKAPEGISFTTEKNTIKISGADKQLVGQIAYEIRKNRLPEPYKGSGIRYKGEIIRRKAGKKAASTG